MAVGTLIHKARCKADDDGGYFFLAVFGWFNLVYGRGGRGGGDPKGKKGYCGSTLNPKPQTLNPTRPLTTVTLRTWPIPCC